VKAIRFILEKLLFLSLVVLAAIPLAHADTPQKGGDLKIFIPQYPRDFNSAIQSGFAVMGPGTQLFASLVEFDEKWQPVPYLAKSWKVSGDGLTYTFHLVQNATFHDGKPITSRDVAFSLDLVKNNHPFGIAMFAAVDRVETPDPHTAVFKLNKPHPALLLSLSPALMPILPMNVYGSEPIRTHPANLKPIGSGPFKFAESRPGESYIFERYENFFRPGLPYLNRLIHTVVKDVSAAEIALRQGEFHYSAFSGGMRLQNIARLKKVDHLVITQRGYEAIGAINYLEFNLRKPPFNDVRVRQAFAHAIDRDFIVQKLHQGFSVKATGPLVHSNLFYSAEVHRYDLNLDKANRLLNEAGYPLKGDGTRFSATLDWYPGFPDHQQILAEYIKPQLRKVGIDIQLRPPADFASWSKRVGGWEYELTMNAIYNYPDPVIGVHRLYLCDNIKNVIWTNTAGYCNPKVDEILKKAAVEMDLGRRKALYAEFQKIVTEDLPLIWTHDRPDFTIHHRDLRNVPLSIWGALAPFDKVFWKEGKEPK